jgi:hypothetical protein
MIWLITMVCLSLYLTLTLGVIVLAAKWAKKRGRRRWPWCTAAGVFMYLLVAWDQIPTHLVTEHYCTTQAGLTVYETPEQWEQENPGVADTLTWRNGLPSKKIGEWGEDTFLNERFISSHRIESVSFLPIDVSIDYLTDTVSGKIVARNVEVVSGYSRLARRSGFSMLKFWVGGQECGSGLGDYLALLGKFKKIGKEVNQ